MVDDAPRSERVCHGYKDCPDLAMSGVLLFDVFSQREPVPIPHQVRDGLSLEKAPSPSLRTAAMRAPPIFRSAATAARVASASRACSAAMIFSCASAPS